MLAEAEVSAMKTDEAAKLNTFVALRESLTQRSRWWPAPPASPTSACGKTNGAARGAMYDFGRQPFGNPAVEWSSQGPLHLGYFRESAIVYWAGGALSEASLARVPYPPVAIAG